jgi:acetyl-CoA C-acetyltransferase
LNTENPVYIRSAELGGKFGHRPELDLRAQVLRAARQALEAAQVDPRDVDALYVGAMGGFGPEEFVGLLPLRIGSELKLRHADILPMMAGTSEAGAWALRQAFDGLRRNRDYKTILVIAGEQMNPVVGQETSKAGLLQERIDRNAVISQVIDPTDARYGLNMLRLGDLFMDMLAARLGLSDHDLHQVLLPWLALEKYRRVSRYPMGHFHKPPVRDYEGYRRRPPVSSHFNLHDVCPTSTGAVALVLSRTPPGDGPRVRIRGIGQGYVPASPVDRHGDLGVSRAIREAVVRACEASGTSVQGLLQADFAIIHDAVPSIELFFLNELCAGDVDTILERLLSGWSNPFGGLKACGHALGASGLLQIAKAYHRFTADPRYIVEPKAFDGHHHCFTTSVGAALTNVIVSVLSSTPAGEEDIPLSPDPAQAERLRDQFQVRTWDSAPYYNAVGAVADGQGVVLGSTRFRHMPSFGDADNPLLMALPEPYVHLVQLDERLEPDKCVAYSRSPIPHGQVVSFEDVDDFRRAVPTDARRPALVRRRPVAADVFAMMEREREFQRYRRAPLQFLDAPVRLGPSLWVYAVLRRPGRIGLLDVVHAKARVIEPQGVEDIGPPGEAVSVTLMAPTWERAGAWLPAVWEQCKSRLGVRHGHLPALRSWGVVPGGSVLSGLMEAAEAHAIAWIARDHVEGTPLSEPARALAGDPATFVRKAIGLTDAVRALHANDMFGRGVVPEQVLRSVDGRLMLLDLPWMESSGTGAPPPASTDALQREDLFGLGRCLYALFTGEPLELNAEGGVGQALSHGLSRGRPDIGSIIGRLLTSSDRERFHRVDDLLARLQSMTV